MSLVSTSKFNFIFLNTYSHMIFNQFFGLEFLVTMITLKDNSFSGRFSRLLNYFILLIVIHEDMSPDVVCMIFAELTPGSGRKYS